MADIDAITKDYEKRIKATDDEAEQRELRAEMREKVADAREQVAAERELSAHRKAVVAEKGLGEWADYVTGSTPEEIDASAAKLAERVSALSKVADDGAAAAAYGQPAAGGGTPPGQRAGANAEFIEDMERRFNNRELMSTQEVARYQRLKGGIHVAEALKEQGVQRFRDLDLSKVG